MHTTSYQIFFRIARSFYFLFLVANFWLVVSISISGISPQMKSNAERHLQSALYEY